MYGAGGYLRRRAWNRCAGTTTLVTACASRTLRKRRRWQLTWARRRENAADGSERRCFAAISGVFATRRLSPLPSAAFSRRFDPTMPCGRRLMCGHRGQGLATRRMPTRESSNINGVFTERVARSVNGLQKRDGAFRLDARESGCELRFRLQCGKSLRRFRDGGSISVVT